MFLISLQKYQLYLLQLEEYEIPRYWKLLMTKGYFWPNQPLRSHIVWTAKARVLLVLSGLVGLLTLILLWDHLKITSRLIAIVISFFAFPLFYTIALAIIWPFEFIAKQLIIAKAKKTIRKASNLKVIGIAGSYGKTTLKNILASVLSAKLKVLATPKSINTPVGIAQWISRSYNKNVDVLIIEMGEHYRGDIKHLCSIANLDVAILCGINEAHLERLGHLDNSIATLFELVENTPKEALILLNADDQNILNNYAKYTQERKVHFFSHHNNPLCELKVQNKQFDSQNLTWDFEVGGLGNFKTTLLGEYAIGDIVASIMIARSLNLTETEIKLGLSKVQPVQHRLFPIKNPAGALVIDDSYNGNPEGACEAIKVLGRFNNRRKIYLTPGLVETGSHSQEAHFEIGLHLSKVADLVILIKNSVTPYIAKALLKNGFNESQILWFKTAPEAHEALKDILKPTDVILFQNDWGDQYV
ncbi:MAG: UDP-N-acetylmuramoyl-tripeptide--D-alanyl-D-alanine ligase [Candidatus Gribaldobacteria bacterium]|nr:UDP-N-acetylmuramoyl-tripeptide--D-alanyl-D-alanine ligase [Candidatus Gribaldobacteria bacterium]